MAAKRSATAQLTSDNWEQEDENEEPAKTGFARASAEELEKRPMKTARRTLATGGAKAGGKLFSSIDLTRGLKPFGSSLLSAKPPFLPATSQPPLMSSSLTTPSFMTPPQTDTHSKYIKKLCALNESVSQWISDHVKKNPCIDLTPIFEDYKKYLKELDAEKEGVEETVAMTTTSETVTMETGDKGNEAMENGGGADDEEEEEEQPEETEKEEKKQLDLIQEPEDDTDCLFALRTKLYYKKDDKFVELGIGKLRVEEIEGGGVRLLLRNDTTLKQILLNVRINSQVPMTLQKNSLLIVCPPNPPLESKSPSKSSDSPDDATPPPVTYALRVKDSNMAEQLHSTIKNKL
ncbi:PREDICTED: nuclear pore complex protein Nup50-like [Amphimedon queenslandica]|uniref:RanBD1 domain-containing protein n=1 Tax=Amphimedon queenslandica TaxID=400682 RepID=A0A1X7VPE9_AMPQE|nr:PREDICTED: nuclear pore complex protein Nup50-like [Amphimedon queenslandica]|eukprot:XP_003383249.1 PREDICTED: nuclear pore complex protein Nup50-like [Amphimedon queenslandica]